MPSITVKNSTGSDAGSLDLDESMFGVQPNVPLMHQVITAQLAARRSGTQSTKTRAEVRGGGKKPFKQKGTGNARQGSSRSPHMSGGGVAHGPKPRKYDQKTPKKMIKLALRSALSDRAADGKVVVVDSWGFEAPKTKDAVKLLGALGVEGKALIVVDIDDTNTIKSFLNLPEVQLIESRELNAYDVLCSDYVIFSHATLPGGGEVLEKKAPAKKAAAKKARSGQEGCRKDRRTLPRSPPSRRLLQRPRPSPRSCRLTTSRCPQALTHRSSPAKHLAASRSRAMPTPASTTFPARPSTTARSPRSGSRRLKTPRPPASSCRRASAEDADADNGDES